MSGSYAPIGSNPYIPDFNQVSQSASYYDPSFIGPSQPIGYSSGSASSGDGFFTNIPTVASQSNPLAVTINAPASAAQPTAAGGASGTIGATLGQTVNDYFVRAIIIILGFIFVAIGLSMFRGQGQSVIPAPIK